MNMKRFLSIFFVLPLVFVSCDLTMDEVSQDVNKPTQVHPKTILTQLCITTFGIEYYGVQPYRLAWQWDQRGGGGHFNFQRRNFISEYRRVTWCYDMIREAERLNDPRYIHLAAYFRASWIFDTTRLFGDVPYTEAAQGRFDDPNFSPKYDPQEEIVAGLLRELAAANEALGDYDNTKIDGDVIFGGDIRKWRQLINLYRLRILINCSMKQTIAGERVGELFAASSAIRRATRSWGRCPTRHPRRKGQYGELQVLQRQQFRFVVPDLQVRRRLDAGSAGTCACRNWPK